MRINRDLFFSFITKHNNKYRFACIAYKLEKQTNQPLLKSIFDINEMREQNKEKRNEKEKRTRR